ncbi:MAG: type II secretion system F family protein [Bacteroides sp.]|jgi:type IV pilus assembly protein PilC|nr:type II secretion system protein [Clostridium sp. CAG:510]
MAAYGYEALNSAGKEIKGSVEADNIEAARQVLKKQGIQVISIKPQSALTKDINIKVGGYPKPRDMSVFCRQFVSMTKAGVTISEALKMLTEQTENDRLREAAEGVRVSVEKGETLASSLAMYPKIFPSLMVHMVEAGEASGSLDVALERMATQFEKSAKTSAMVKKAMIYPVAVCIVALAVVVVMLVVVIPNYATMFESLGTDLPALTKAVQAASNFIITKWFILVPAIIAIVVLIKMFAETDTGIHFFDKLKLSIPAYKNLEVKTASAQMARTLSTLMAAGVPLVDAVEIVSNVMPNVYFKEALQDCKNEIIIGQPLSKPLEQCGLFPPMVYHMTRIGEETGATEEMLAKQADYYEEEVEAAVASFMAAMEPVIIIVLAAIVLVLVGACLMPMMTMYETLNAM